MSLDAESCIARSKQATRFTPHIRVWPLRLLVSALPVLASCRSKTIERPAALAPEWLLERARQEADLAARSKVLHDFRFTESREASGITFLNRIVDDADSIAVNARLDELTRAGILTNTYKRECVISKNKITAYRRP